MAQNKKAYLAACKYARVAFHDAYRGVGAVIYMHCSGNSYLAIDHYTETFAEIDARKAIPLINSFNKTWPKATYLDLTRHLIANA